MRIQSGFANQHETERKTGEKKKHEEEMKSTKAIETLN